MDTAEITHRQGCTTLPPLKFRNTSVFNKAQPDLIQRKIKSSKITNLLEQKRKERELQKFLSAWAKFQSHIECTPEEIEMYPCQICLMPLFEDQN